MFAWPLNVCEMHHSCKQMYKHVPGVMVSFLSPVWTPSTELASIQSAGNSSSQTPVPYTVSCYGIFSSAGLIYSSFLLHTSQTVLSSPTWPGGASSREMPERGNINCWRNRSTPGALKACKERLAPSWPPGYKVEKGLNWNASLDIDMFLLFAAFQSSSESLTWRHHEETHVMTCACLFYPHYRIHTVAWCVAVMSFQLIMSWDNSREQSEVAGGTYWPCALAVMHICSSYHFFIFRSAYVRVQL